MAKNYSMSEAVAIIAEGKNLEAIAELGKRFPVLTHKVTVVATKAGEDFVNLMSYLPEHLTANKVNTAIKAGITEGETETDEETEGEATEAETEVKTIKSTKAKVEAKEETKNETESGETDYDSMSSKELWEILGKAGKRKDCKDKMGGTTKAHMAEYIKKYGLGDEAKDEEVEEVEETETTTESENPYEGKSAMELFKECKKRGIKAAPKKPAKFYADLLAKDDEAKTQEAEETEEDDDWGDDESTEEVPPKEEKKSTKKSSKKAEKAEEDEDDDWDI